MKNIMAFIKRCWHYFVPPKAIDPPPLPVTEPPPLLVSVNSEDDDPVKLDFSLRGAVLDDLDLFFTTLKRFRQADPDAFDLYSQIGCYLTPQTSLIDKWRVSPWFNQHRPSFGAVFIASKKDHEERAQRDVVMPLFFYFTKYKAEKAPPRIQRTNHGDVYLLTAYYDDKHTPLKRYPVQLPITLLPDGTVQPLRQLHETTTRIRVKKNSKDKKRGESFSIPVRKWGMGAFTKMWAEDRNETENDLVTRLFVLAANFFEASAIGGMTKVSIRKHNLHLALSVDPKWTKRFFNDRNKSYLPNGSTKRIFHIVRAHKRIVKGEERYIKFHFRGEREFDWNGYNVSITVPFWKGYAGVVEFNAGAEDFDKNEPVPSSYVSQKKLAWMLNLVANGHRLPRKANGDINYKITR